MKKRATTLEAGWGWPPNLRKAHYFREGEPVSICATVAYTGPREAAEATSPDNCRACMRKLAALARAAAKPAAKDSA